jgi:hypothetical protein
MYPKGIAYQSPGLQRSATPGGGLRSTLPRRGCVRWRGFARSFSPSDLPEARWFPPGLKARQHEAQGFSPVLGGVGRRGLKGRQRGSIPPSLPTLQAGDSLGYSWA